MMSQPTVHDDRLGAKADAFYEALMQTHEGLSEASSHALNARLILLMGNQIADFDKLKTLLETARSYDQQHPSI